MQLKSGDEKYDAIYFSTPCKNLTTSQLAKLDVKSLVKDDSLLFMWSDTFSVGESISLASSYGFQFESVYQISDLTTYPKQCLRDVVTEVGEEVSEVVEEPVKTETMVVEESAVKEKKVIKRVKKLRAPPLSLPIHMATSDGGSSRSMCEMLLLFYRGDRSVLKTLTNEKAGTIGYQIVQHPELGKKSRSVPKKNIYLDPENVCDRPDEFLDTVLNHLVPSARVLEMFGSTVRSKVDSCGPNIPGGFSTGYNSVSGLSGTFNKVLRGMRKVNLQTLNTALTKMGNTEVREEKVVLFKTVADLWKPVVAALGDLKSSISYDWGSEDPELPTEWLRLAVIFYTNKNIADFGSLRRRKKKRKTSVNGKPACHGIAKPMIVSKELTEFLGLKEGEKISRTHSVKLINDYVKEHGLQNPERKIEIIPDEKLLKILNPPEDYGKITYFRMCGLLGVHFPPSAKKIAEDKKKSEEVAEQGDSKKQKVEA